MTIAELEAWIEAAQPGARLHYFSGWFAGDGSEALNERLRAEEARGMLFLVQQKRSTHGAKNYLAVRSSRAFGEEPPKPQRGLRDSAGAQFGGRVW